MPTEPDPQAVDRYADLKTFVAEWHRPIEPGDGYTEAEITDAEARLGFRLPEALRELYALVGKMRELFYETNEIVLLKSLNWSDGVNYLARDDENASGFISPYESTKYITSEIGLVFWRQDLFGAFIEYAIRSEDKDYGDYCWFVLENNGWSTELKLSIEDAILLNIAVCVVTQGRFSATGSDRSVEGMCLQESLPNLLNVEWETLKWRDQPVASHFWYMTPDLLATKYNTLTRRGYRILDECLILFDNNVFVSSRDEETLFRFLQKHQQLYWLVKTPNGTTPKDK